MARPFYIGIYELNELQIEIMHFIGDWVRIKKTPVPQKQIITAIKRDGLKDYMIVTALNALLTKGYIRRAIVISNKSFYVMLRSI